MKHFCSITLALFVALGHSVKGQSVQPAITLKVLTWNIWMMPPLTFQSPSNTQRAAAIADILDGQDADIICLEKAFDGRARRVIRERLKRHYPFVYGPANNGFSIRTNSGVWVLSEFPLKHYRSIQFHKASNLIEWFARKGAIALDGEKQGQHFRIIATHLAGEEGAYYTVKAQHARSIQLQQLVAELLYPLEANTPVIIAGDFATPRYIAGDPDCGTTEAYQETLSTLQAVNGPEYRITLNDNQEINTLADDNVGRRDELDYIFLRTNGTSVSGKWELKVFRQKGWDRKLDRPDLSYRYAVEAIFTF